MNDIEQTFVKNFITRNLRERWLSRLASKKTRSKLLSKLAHTLEGDLDSRYMYVKDNLPDDVAVRIQNMLSEWKRLNPKQLCYIIALKHEKDGQMMNLAEAEVDYDLTFGAIIIIIPDKLAYYHTERSNLNCQPFYILFRQ